MVFRPISQFLIAAQLFIGIAIMDSSAANSAAAKYRAYVGTYTSGESKGIYAFSFDDQGKVGEPKLVAELENPSFVAIHPNKRYLYAVSELSTDGGKSGGRVHAYKIESTGQLTAINDQATNGGAPCHLVVDKAGKVVLVANYMGGNTVALPIAEDGSLAPICCDIKHEGSSVNKRRQEAPHAHSINLDAANQFAFAADLGIDKMLVFKFTPEGGEKSLQLVSETELMPGSGPRHFDFHPNGNYAYVINEMLQTITTFSYDGKSGKLSTLQTISTVPKAVPGNSTAEIRVHPSGKFVYGSNRGHDSIAIFSVDENTGKLAVIGHEWTQGKTPRNFIIDPKGKYLLAENQQSDSVIVYKVEQDSGRLTPMNELSVPSPVCIRFLEL